jgi:hypothetical protein
MNISKNSTINLEYILNYALFISVFVLSYQIRGIITSSSLKNINIIAVVSIVVIILKAFNKINKKMLYIIMFAIVSCLYSQYLNNKSLKENIIILSCLVLPIFLLIKQIENENFKAIFKLYLTFFNLMTILLFVFAIIDKISGDMIANFFAGIFNDPYFLNGVKIESNLRYYSFMGHPLYNTQLFLMFYVLNICYKRNFHNTWNVTWVVIISILGIAFTASKTGIVLIIVCLVFMIPYRRKFIFLLCLLLIGLILIKVGLFDSLIYRFTTGTLTSGRNELWDILNSYNYFPIKFFSGYGSGFNSLYNDFVQGASMAFEYPIKLYALEYGILYTMILYSIIFIYPTVIFLRNRHYALLFNFMIIFLDVNTYNGIGLGIDIMLMYCVFVYMIINLSRYLKNNNNNPSVIN